MGLAHETGCTLVSSFESQIWPKPEEMTADYIFPRGSVNVRSLKGVWRHVVEGVRWSIGNGGRARFWWDRWLHSAEPLVNLVNGAIPEVDLFATVARGWELHCLVCLPFSELSFGHRRSAVVEGNMEMGRYAANSTVSLVGNSWQVVDELGTLPATCCGFPACDRCGAAQETVLHVLRDCHDAVKVWSDFVPIAWRSRFFSLTLEDWIWANLLNQIGIDVANWECVFGVTLWRIWSWRNAMIFEGKAVGS
ncbi:OLC1v1022590C1 [Oldenlandia corymbosa var. corymbosa]|uniref:OLC1v1022590C1 n=1 Tax=Oldenlandia corymbosa var. corymbosa TaxID=529605 RepID=A0AAV1C1V3_OLDCO|nr:OLC1v1022590C1 [Oldenlandia corymbosa var. corymbosa]